LLPATFVEGGDEVRGEHRHLGWWPLRDLTREPSRGP
jgi:hypothetical protein